MAVNKISIDQWKKEGEQLFGKDIKKWKFVCSHCGHVQSLQDFIDQGINNPQNCFFMSCIGRWIEGCKGELGNKIEPCNYTLGGLFRFHKTEVENEEGRFIPVFEFAR